MEVLSNLIYGFSVAITPINLLYCIVGVVTGTIIGALPGLGPSAGLAVLLPLTFGADPVAGIIMLAGIYYGAMYGGSITSILINTPGDSAAVMTTMDGYPLAQQGRAGAAMGMAAFSSFIGGSASVIAFMFLAPVLAKAALSFGPPEYFALMVLGLTTLAGMTGNSPVKGFISALLGLFFAIVGLDLVTGLPRYTYGQLELFSGIDFIPVAMGVFGIAEILVTAEKKVDFQALKSVDLSWRKLFPTLKDWALSKWAIIRGTVVGFLIGMLPGAGATIASFISYGMAKKSSKHPEKFGQGAIEGVAAPETANNAASVGAFVPLLTLGVPGSASTAILMGALMMFDLRPGPLLFERNPDFVWGLIASMYVGNLVLLAMIMIFIPVFVRILQVPRASLNAVVMAFILVGAYSLNNSMFDVYLTLGFGVLGYFMKKLNYPGAPMVLALVLGALLENSLRQSLILSEGSIGIFFARPISAIIMVIAIGAIVFPMIKNLVKRNKASAA
ncbi:tripartite tricarboxylate transporter permease [Desulfotomaculum sp. 1211_IL3151]|uniref:tripartite tricarboxylate transporter permease n=1 Tax=Desulfotomaculum sp. 1211_IL3151 TaxID=3084055 RepID=UPI002FDB107F